MMKVATWKQPSSGATTYTSPITIDHTQCGASNSVNFPVVVNITDARFKSSSNGGHIFRSDAFDLGFYSDAVGTTIYNWKLLNYDPVAGSITFKVKIPTVDHTANTTLYAKYGSTSITTFQGNNTIGGNTGSVYDANYVREYELNGDVLDATGAANGIASSVTYVAGIYGQAASFNGTTSKVTASDVGLPSGASNRTISAWIQVQAAPTGFCAAIGYGTAAIAKLCDIGSYNSPARSVAYTQFGSSAISATNTLTNGTWVYASATIGQTPNNVTLYINGSPVVTNTETHTTVLTGTMYLGTDVQPSPYAGYIMDASIESVIRSADWEILKYNCGKSSPTILTLGAETTP